MELTEEIKLEAYKITKSFIHTKCSSFLYKEQDSTIEEDYISIAYGDVLNKHLKNYNPEVAKLTTYLYAVLNKNKLVYYYQAKYNMSETSARSICIEWCKKVDNKVKEFNLRNRLKVYNTESITIGFDSIESIDDDHDHYNINLTDDSSENSYNSILDKEVIDDIIYFVNNDLKQYSIKSKNIFLDYVLYVSNKGKRIGCQTELAKKYSCSRQYISSVIERIRKELLKHNFSV